MNEENDEYLIAEQNTGDNRNASSVAGNAVTNKDINNNKKAGKFLQNAYTSSVINPGYTLL